MLLPGYDRPADGCRGHHADDVLPRAGFLQCLSETDLRNDKISNHDGNDPFLWAVSCVYPDWDITKKEVVNMMICSFSGIWGDQKIPPPLCLDGALLNHRASFSDLGA